MPRKPKLTLVQGGVQTLEQYKEMLNTMLLHLVGRPAKFTEEEWQEKYNEFVEKAQAALKKKRDGGGGSQTE